MKKLILIAIVAIFTLSACYEPGSSTTKNINQELLPPELKGLKVYYVELGGLDGMYVAILNNKVIGSNYREGKHSENVAFVDSADLNKVIYENDSIVVLRK